MAGILKRFKDIMSANFENILSKHERPDKMIDHYLNELEQELGDVKAETANVMATRKGADRRVEETQKKVKTWQGYADAAILKENDDDAKMFLSKMADAQAELDAYIKAAEAAKENEDKMLKIHDKITSDMAYLKSQRDLLITQYTVSQATKSMSGISDSYTSKMAASVDGFNRMKDKIIHEMDVAEAAEKLNGKDSETESLCARYTQIDHIDNMLAEAKKRLGVPMTATA